MATAGLAPLALAACGTSSSATGTTVPAGAKGKGAANAVVSLVAQRSAEVLPAAPAAGAHTGEATFTVTALDRSGKPVAGAPVGFYIGPMVALSGSPPKSWDPAKGSGARYVAAVSRQTNGAGQASITLLGQPNGTMEMIAVRVGSLSTYARKKHAAIATMDAWWSSGQGANTATAGDYLTTSVLAAKLPASSGYTLVIGAHGPSGAPIPHATISITDKLAGKASAGMGGMTAPTTTLMTNSSGLVDYPVVFTHGRRPRAVLRIVPTEADGKRVSGALAVQLAEK